MEITLLLAGLRLRFLSDPELNIDPELNNFIIPTVEADVTIRLSRDWDSFALPSSPQLGEDTLCRYYREGDTLYCLTRGGFKGAVACTVYSPDCRDILCVLNEKPFRMPPKDLGSILRMIPMREIFLHFDTLFLHASQISYRGRGILFSAPSGTGKSTQAKLWQKYRGAEIVCNDRTLLRKTDGLWRTYGYPLDGSEPVRSNEVNQLGCIVLLEQGTENCVQRLRPAKAISRLMQQAVMDCWSSTARTQTMELIIALLGEIPVYLLTCTPDERAVETLEEMLMKDEVIPCGGNFRSTLE